MQTRLKSTFSCFEHVELLGAARPAALVLDVGEDGQVGRVVRPADRVQEGALGLVHLQRGAHLAERAPVLVARVGGQVLGQLVDVHGGDVLGKRRAPVGAGCDDGHPGPGGHLPQVLELLLGAAVDGGVDDAGQAVDGRGHAQLFRDQLHERLGFFVGKRIVESPRRLGGRNRVGRPDVQVLVEKRVAVCEGRRIDVAENRADDGAGGKGDVLHSGRCFLPAPAAGFSGRRRAAAAAGRERQAGPRAQYAERLTAREEWTIRRSPAHLAS